MRERQFCFWLALLLAVFLPTRAAVVSGSVKDDSGQDIAALRLEAGNDHGIWFTSNVTDGKFELNLIPGTWRISAFDASGAGYLDLDYLIDVASAAIVTNLVFPKLNSRIEGRVLSDAGVALTNVQMDFRRMMGARELWVAERSDSNGVFSARVPDGTWTVRPYPGEIDRVFNPIPAQMITVAGETNSQVLFVANSPTNFIRGRVTDDSGAPVTNLTVAAWIDYGNFRYGTTDAEGYYSIGVYAAYWAVEAQGLKERRLLMRTERYVAEITAATAIATVDIKLWRAPLTLDVSIVDEHGAPYAINNASIQADSTVGGERVSLGQMAVDGKASFAVTPGSWWLSCGFTGSAPGLPIWVRTANLSSESTSAKLVVPKGPFDSNFSGQVVDETGRGLTNFGIRLSSESQTRYTDESGRFDFTLIPGSYYIRSADTNYVLPSLGAQIRPDWPGERTYVARKINSEVTIRLNFPAGMTPTWGGVYATTRTNGHIYYISHDGPDPLIRLPMFSGTWTIQAWSTGFREQAEQTVILSSPNREVDFDFEPAITNAAIHGRVLDHSGAPMKYINAGAVTGGFSRTDEEGRFEITTTVGKGELSLSGWGPFAMTVPIEAKPGENFDLGDVIIPKLGSKVTLTFVDMIGNPIVFGGYAANSVYATCSTAAAKYQVSDGGVVNSLSLLLAPGIWRLEFYFSEEEFVTPAPLEFEVGEADFEKKIVVRKVSRIAGPSSIDAISSANSETTVRLSSENSRYLDLEWSTDLKIWNFLSSHVMTSSNLDVKISEPSNVKKFFRAVSAY